MTAVAVAESAEDDGVSGSALTTSRGTVDIGALSSGTGPAIGKVQVRGGHEPPRGFHAIATRVVGQFKLTHYRPERSFDPCAGVS